MSKPNSIAELFFNRVEQSQNDLAFQYPKGEDGWQSATWAELGKRVAAIAAGFVARDIQVEERIGILCSTRYEWIVADLAILSAGAATTTIYPSNTSEECAFILDDSSARWVVCENDEQVEKILGERPALKSLQGVVVIEGESSNDGFVISLQQLEEEGTAHLQKSPKAVDDRIAELKPKNLSTLIYTSGTTGRPKGVELLQEAWLFEGEALEAIKILSKDDHQYLWLPLSHSFGKVLLAIQLQCGFSTTVDGRIPKLIDNLAVIKPTFMAAAPRIFEKVYNKIVTQAADAGGLKYAILKWAIRLGIQVSKLRQDKMEPAGLLALKYKVADKLVFSKLRARFGGKLRFFVSGSAPLSRDMAEFFHGAGILILEGYGLTESSAASFVNHTDTFRFGTVGKALPGVDVKIADDGEILLHGPGIMRGYHNLAEETAECLSADGWLHTGDIGTLDGEHLRITDRKKNLIKTSGGKYVAPQKLESRLKALCPYLGHVVVHGNNRNFCSALVTLDPENILAWAEEKGLPKNDLTKVARSEAARLLVQDAVDTLNTELARYESIKKFAILDTDLSVEAGTLTASMKVRRKFVEESNMAILNSFYAGALKSVA